MAVAEKKQKDASHVTTGVVRLSFVHVFEPYSNDPENDKKYSACLLIPKSDTKTIAKIRKAQEFMLEQSKTSKFGGKIPVNWVDTLHDGDEERDTDEYPEYIDHMYIDVSANPSYPPGVVDRQLNPIMDQTEVYSGCFAKVAINAFPFNSNGKKGISFGLLHVMKWEDGEALGGSGRTSAEDFFEAEDADEDGLL